LPTHKPKQKMQKSMHPPTQHRENTETKMHYIQHIRFKR
jgi:hypothetical protein